MQVWTEDRVESLRALWAEGHSAAHIGARLGTTRNAVIGKANRLKLEKRAGRTNEVASTRRRAIERQRIIRLPKLPKTEPTDIHIDRRDPDYADCLHIEQLAHDSCRWPIGWPHRFCGRKQERGSYCREHHVRSIEKGRRPCN